MDDLYTNLGHDSRMPNRKQRRRVMAMDKQKHSLDAMREKAMQETIEQLKSSTISDNSPLYDEKDSGEQKSG